MERSKWRSGVELWLRWLAATALGWVLGFMVAVLLSELLLMPFLHDETNLLVGLSVGGVISALQAAAVRPWVRLRAGWIGGGMVVLGPPFVLAYVFDMLELDMDAVPVMLAFWSAVAVCGLAGAVLQSRALRPLVSRWKWWIGGAAVSWGLAVASSGVVDFMGAGVVLGASGGALMVWILGVARPEPLAGAGVHV